MNLPKTTQSVETLAGSPLSAARAAYGGFSMRSSSPEFDKDVLRRSLNHAKKSHSFASPLMEQEHVELESFETTLRRDKVDLAEREAQLNQMKRKYMTSAAANLQRFNEGMLEGLMEAEAGLDLEASAWDENWALQLQDFREAAKITEDHLRLRHQQEIGLLKSAVMREQTDAAHSEAMLALFEKHAKERSLLMTRISKREEALLRAKAISYERFQERCMRNKYKLVKKMQAMPKLPPSNNRDSPSPTSELIKSKYIRRSTPNKLFSATPEKRNRSLPSSPALVMMSSGPILRPPEDSEFETFPTAIDFGGSEHHDPVNSSLVNTKDITTPEPISGPFLTPKTSIVRSRPNQLPLPYDLTNVPDTSKQRAVVHSSSSSLDPKNRVLAMKRQRNLSAENASPPWDTNIIAFGKVAPSPFEPLKSFLSQTSPTSSPSPPMKQSPSPYHHYGGGKMVVRNRSPPTHHHHQQPSPHHHRHHHHQHRHSASDGSKKRDSPNSPPNVLSPSTINNDSIVPSELYTDDATNKQLITTAALNAKYSKLETWIEEKIRIVLGESGSKASLLMKKKSQDPSANVSKQPSRHHSRRGSAMVEDIAPPITLPQTTTKVDEEEEENDATPQQGNSVSHLLARLRSAIEDTEVAGITEASDGNTAKQELRNKGIMSIPIVQRKKQLARENPKDVMQHAMPVHKTTMVGCQTDDSYMSITVNPFGNAFSDHTSDRKAALRVLEEGKITGTYREGSLEDGMPISSSNGSPTPPPANRGSNANVKESKFGRSAPAISTIEENLNTGEDTSSVDDMVSARGEGSRQNNDDDQDDEDNAKGNKSKRSDRVDLSDIFSCVRHNRPHAVEALLNGATTDIDVRDDFGNTPLMVACQNNHKRLSKLCLKRGADVNKQNYKGNTALHFATAYGYASLAKYLVSKGADESLLNMDGLSPHEGLSANVRSSRNR